MQKPAGEYWVPGCILKIHQSWWYCH